MSIPTAATSSWAFSLPGSIISSRGGGMMMMMKKPYSSGNAIVAAFPLRMSSSSSSSYYRRENQVRPLLACHFRKIRRSDGTTPSYDNTSTLRKALADESLMMDLFEKWMQNNGRVYATQEEKQTRYEKFKETVKVVYDNNKVRRRSCTLCVSFLADMLPGDGYGKELLPRDMLRGDGFGKELVDCVYPNEDSCKKGSTFVDAFGYVMRNELVTDSQYPYKARTGKCRLNSDSEGVKIRGYQRVKKFDEKALQYAVSRQPICVTIWVDIKFENYTGGLFKIDFKDELNPSLHDVLVVGYGITRSGAPYWLIKNNYDTEWGEKGYMRMIRNYGNEGLRCITARPAYPIY